ncbi:hypothetical protein SMICM17S_02244 [Streptomyces microflavus]
MARIQAVEHSFAACPLPVGPGPSGAEAGAVDADVAGAVLRTARAVLAERVAQAAEIDASFAGDLAGRVADFTLDIAYRLLGRAPHRPLPLRHSPSAVILHAGTDRTWPDLAHHTISFGAAWKSTFRELTRAGELMSDPSLLITRPTATDPTLAPPGKHLHYVLAPCPNTEVGPGVREWRELGPRYRDELLAELERREMPGLGAAIEEEGLVTPVDWTAQGHAAGTPFSVAHTFPQTGPFRPRNLVRGTVNAVLAGCGTTPGVGVPTVLISGKLAAERITGPRPVPRPVRRGTTA